MKSIVGFLVKSLATLLVTVFGFLPSIAALLFGLAFVDDQLPQPVLGIAEWLFDDPLGVIIGGLMFIVIQSLAFGASFWLMTEKIWREKIERKKEDRPWHI